MLAMFAGLLVLLALGSTVHAAKELPVGIKPCKHDNTLNDCIMKASKDAIKKLANSGDPSLRIPVLDPLFIEKVEYYDKQASRNIAMNVTLSKINIHGLKKAELTKSEFDVKNLHMKWTFKVPELKLLSDYELNGKFLLVPVTGKGKSTVTLSGVTFSYDLPYSYEERKGKKYVKIGEPVLNYEPEKLTVNLDNLFNGDKTLGKSMNEMMNENWQELNKMIGRPIAGSITKILTSILDKITKDLPYDKIFNTA